MNAASSRGPEPDNPSATANPASRLFFWWMKRLVWKSYKESLTEDDLYGTLNSDKSKELGENLERNWRDEVEKAKAKSQKPRLLVAILKTFWLRYSLYGLLLCVDQLILRIAQPLLLGKLIQFFTPGSTMTYNEACGYAVALAAIVFVKNCFYHHYMLLSQLMGMRVRVACCSLLYRKVLSLCKQVMDHTATGQIVNLMTNDVSRFDLACQFGHFMWLSVLQVIIITYCLYLYVQESALIGFAFIFLATMPVQSVLGQISSNLRKKIAVLTDERMCLMNEIVMGVQVIKMYAWEKPFASLVAKARKSEIAQIIYSAILRAYLLSSIVFVERASLLVTLAAYWLLGNYVLPYQVFVMAQYYSILNLTLTYFFPMAVCTSAECKISVNRLQEFLERDEHESVIKKVTRKGDLKIEGANASWVASGETLKNISLHTLPGTLCAVIGPVGSGKSSLLHALLGELALKTGSISLGGSIAYVSQEPWIFVGTVQQNILFGLPYNQERYHEVVRVCALQRDFELFPNGDKNLVGEKGITLSGGQRARINLARAVYQNADIYLMDDPLSAVDTNVGRHLFDECICNYLGHKTRVLVTHQLQYLQDANHIVILNNGQIDLQGSFSEIIGSGINFAKLLSNNDDDEGDPHTSIAEREKRTSEEVVIRRSVRLGSQRNTNVYVPNSAELPELANVNVLLDETGKLHKDETTNQESVGFDFTWSTYWQYFRAGGNPLTIVAIVSAFIIAQIITSGSDYWLTYWSNSEVELYELSKLITRNDTRIVDDSNRQMFVEVYAALVVACIFFTMLRSASFFKLCMRASQCLHDSMFGNILQAPMKFFDTNPSGRILNRFSKDVGAMDELLPQAMLFMTQIYLILCGIMIIVLIVNYFLIIPVIIIGFFFYYISRILISTAREVKKLEAVRRSPVFSHLSDSLNGLTTIRSSNIQDIIQTEFDIHQDKHTSAWFLFVNTSIALGFWLDFLNAIFITVVTFSFLIISPESFRGGSVGLAITQSLVLTGMLQHGILQMSETVSQMSSVERILEYTNIVPETNLESGDKPPNNWPTNGAITFNGLSLRYSNTQPPVLKNLNFAIQSGYKIGIVGRTGAGKSSLITALFRLAPVEGSLLIDGINTASLSLHDLRKHISIIPQEPVLFSATVRYNLDPFNEYEDHKLWAALEEVELKSCVKNLDTLVLEGGSNFSVGQRQLMCLARAVLRNNKILVLDEATANVDPETDALIQQTIRKKFSKCTVLIIAHRLHTVMDSDRILVMDAGIVVEFDNPHILLQNNNGYLYKLVQETGKSMAEQLQQSAKEAYNSISESHQNETRKQE